MRQLLILASVMFCLTAAGAMAQGVAPDQADQNRNFAQMWDPDRMIERSVSQAVKRYDLTPEQAEQARKMTSQGVNQFLDKHEDDLRRLVSEVLQARLAGKTPSAEQVQAWAKRAEPLFEEAKKAIVEGNQDFRQYLTDEQKRTFDIDQKVIAKQFAWSEERLDRWSAGQFNPQTDSWVFGQQNTARPDATVQRRTPPPRQTQPAQPDYQPQLDRWDLAVRSFIHRYELDAAQSSQAYGILADSKKRAQEYWLSRKPDIEAANQRIQEVLADEALKDQAVAARKHLDDLNQPVEDVYKQMLQRLDQIPTDTQRQAYEQKRQERRRHMRESRAGDPPRTAISATSQSQPTGARATAEDLRGRIKGPAATRPAASRAASTQPAAVR